MVKIVLCQNVILIIRIRSPKTGGGKEVKTRLGYRVS